MKIEKKLELSLQQLAVLAVTLGRELERKSRDASLCDTGKSAEIFALAFCGLAERDPFGHRNEASLSAAYRTLADELRSEIRGVEQRFLCTRSDADGEYDEVCAVPVYSERGERLLAVQETFSRFLAAREQTLDRLAAERSLRRLLAG